jgi:hypothetical protein
MASATTLVSAFFPIRSKFPPEYYLQWGRTFLQLSAPLVLFVDAALEDAVKALRGSRPTYIVPMAFDDLDTWVLYMDKWIANHAVDPEKDIHTPELYAIWAQKAFFVEQAVHLNIFKTEYFFWCDFGAFRNPAINPVILTSFPSSQHLEPDRILFQSIQDLTPADTMVRPDGIPCERIGPHWNKDRIVGGLWGGGAAACLRWKQAYQAMLEEYFAAGRFAGKDQIVMLSAYVKDPSLGVVVRCTRSQVDPWFFLEHLLSSEPNVYEENPTYRLG